MKPPAHKEPKTMNGHTPGGLNTNSYISIGLMITIIACALWINGTINDLKFDLKTLASDPWTGKDMFKWAVQLQRENPQIKIPEPEHK